MAEDLGPEQVLHRVRAQEGGEQGGHRGEVRHLVRCGLGHALGDQAVVQALGRSPMDSPTIISEKKMPMDSTCAEFWKVVFIPEPAPRCSGGRLFMTPSRLGAPKAPMVRPMDEQQDAEGPVGEVDGQQLEERRTQRRAQHPAGGEGSGAVAVGQDARDGPGDQEARA